MDSLLSDLPNNLNFQSLTPSMHAFRSSKNIAKYVSTKCKIESPTIVQYTPKNLLLNDLNLQTRIISNSNVCKSTVDISRTINAASNSRNLSESADEWDHLLYNEFGANAPKIENDRKRINNRTVDECSSQGTKRFKHFNEFN
jgi:hypothetical protein